MDQRRGESGHALLVVVMVMAVAVIAIVMTTRIGVAVTDRAKASAAADAAAIAGATGGRQAAEQIASDDGGSIESFVQRGSEVEVTVRVGDRRATARARAEIKSP